MRIAFCASEVFPFAKTGGLADVSGALPQALEKLGIELIIVLPYYGSLNKAGFRFKKIDQRTFKTKIGRNIKVYLINSRKHFHRKGLYGSQFGDYADNFERFHFYCLQTLLLLKRLRIKIDIVHCHDWHAALIPVYLREKFSGESGLEGAKSLLTIHNMAYQGIFPKCKLANLKFKKRSRVTRAFEFYGKINLLKAGILYSDGVNTVSDQYAKEIKSRRLGFGLDKVLWSRKDQIKGVLNGLNVGQWDPRKDSLIRIKYSVRDYHKSKRKNKEFLQKSFKLLQSEKTMLIGFVARLSPQKGIDLILKALKDLTALNIQLIILGIGERSYHRKLNDFALQYAQKMAFCGIFSEKIAHQIYAGSDAFLIPSQFEPCGISQMICMKYGTIPIVFKTGGLAQTVRAQGRGRNTANGFVFNRYSKSELVRIVNKAQKVFQNKKQWHQLVRNAFHTEFSWQQSARKYQKIYKCLSSG